MGLPGDDPDPLLLLGRWLQAAREAGAPLPEAMTLATASPDGMPSARMVIWRGTDRGIVFFTDTESDKGLELAANPRAAVVLHWLTPEHRQVRVVGIAEEVSRDEADAYWHVRTTAACRAAVASRQSRVIPSLAAVEERVAELQAQFPDGTDIPRPRRWSGFRIVPTSIEFWQEAPDGLHERIRYRARDAMWTQERLSP